MQLTNKILFILKTPPPYGGGEIMHQYLYDYYKSKDNILILTLSSFRRNKSNQGLLQIWKIFETLKFFLAFFILNFKEKPKIIYFSVGKSFSALLRDSVNIIIPRLLGQKVILELHGSSFHFMDEPVKHIIGKKILQKSFLIRVLSNSIKKELNNYGIQNTFVLENGINIFNMEQRKKANLQFLFVGTLSKEKGFDNLIRSLIAIQKSSGRRLNLICLGEWKSEKFKKKILGLIHQHNLQSSVEFLGPIINEKKWDIYAQSDVLILPSLSEGQPLVLLEALGMGLVIIATDVGGISDTLKSSRNLLIQPGNQDDLTNSIRNILAYDVKTIRKIQEENRQIFLTRFTLEKYLKATDKLLNDILLK